ncbi:hypothetical protein DBV23_08070 [Edwardsiella ictaluri]|nr:hypothetical protein DBV23_08070 [Edwardsiella ictaluri]
MVGRSRRWSPATCRCVVALCAKLTW